MEDDRDDFAHLRGDGLNYVFARDDPDSDVRRLLWMTVIVSGGELRLLPRAYPGDGLWGQKTHVELDPSTGEIVLTVQRVRMPAQQAG
jgi:hypothetical protein